jgi:arylsulfatase A-like enzyme
MSEDLDESLGRILEGIAEAGIADNTYIIYTSDNGSYPTGSTGNINGPLHGWKTTLWEGGIRVPFVVAGPKVASRKQIDIPIVGYDLFPTVCAWLGINKLPEGLEGGSFAETVNTTAATPSSVVGKHDMLVFHFPHYKHNKGAQPSTAVRYNHYKLLKFYETGELHLYDLEKDLSETRNIARESPGLVYKLHKMMESYLRKVNAGMPRKNPSFDPNLDPAKRFLAIKEKLMDTAYIDIYATKGPAPKDPAFSSPQ